jgi:hypothetical protein
MIIFKQDRRKGVILIMGKEVVGIAPLVV